MILNAPAPRVVSPTCPSAMPRGPRRRTLVGPAGLLALAAIAAGGCTPSRGSVYAATLRGDVMNRISLEPERYAAAFPENLGVGGLGPVELASVD